MKGKKTNMNCRPRTSSWSELPQELLESIATRLETQGQIRHFQAVCKNWRQSVPVSSLPPKLPLSPFLPLKLSFAKYSQPIHYELQGKSLTLVAFSVCLIRPTTDSTERDERPWLVTVEELNPGKLYLRRPLSRTAYKHLPEDVPRVLDLTDFDVSEISKGYYLRSEDHLDDMFTKNYLPHYLIRKVVLFKNPAACAANPTINDYTAIILCKDYTLHAVRLGHEKLKCVHLCAPGKVKVQFDDVVSFMDEVYAVDRRGRVWAISYDSFTVRNIVDEVPFEVCGNRKKWLVEISGLLYLVRRCSGKKVNIEIYELDIEQRCWGEVVLDDDELLFVTFDGCFTASIPGFRRNRIIFYRGCFYSSSGCIEPDVDIFRIKNCHWSTWVRDLDIAVYDPREYSWSKTCQHISQSCLTGLFWPPPEWLWTDACSSGRSSEGEEVYSDEGEVSGTVSNTDALLSHELSGSPSVVPHGEDHGAKCTPLSTPSGINVQEHVHQEGSHEEPQSDPIHISPITLPETCRRLEELNIRPDLVPTLQKIWAKHGDITEGSAVRNGDILARALEALAMVVETLQCNSVRSLKDCQVDYLSSVLSDLQFMQFSVDWLLPSIEKALALHKSKPLIDTLIDMDNAKTQAQETRTKLLDELAKVNEKEKSLEEEMKRVSERIPVSGPLDLHGCLGGLC